MLHIIVAYGLNRVIGKDNGIPWQIPADLAHFKELTMGHTVIMGRRTYESIGRILPGRENIIVSSTLQAVEGAVVVPTLKDALDAATHEEVFVIGGAALYREALPLAEQLDLTEVHLAPEGDTWFPEIDLSDYEELSRQVYDGTADKVPSCTFITYRKKS